MRKPILFAILIFSVILTACEDTASISDGAVVSAVSHNQDENINYANSFSEALVAYYLGRDYDIAYSLPFYGLTPLGDDNLVITLEGAEDAVSRMLYRVAGMAEKLSLATPNSDEDKQSSTLDDVPPDLMFEYPHSVSEASPIATTEFIPPVRAPDGSFEDMGYSAGLAQGAYFQSLSGTGNLVHLSATAQNKKALTDKELASIFFPKGTVPNIRVKKSSGIVTDEFKAWFLNESKTAGLMDLRIFQGNDGSWCIAALDCSPESGGNSVKIFDYTITLSEDEIGETTEIVANSPKYNMIRDSHIYFDSGAYRAVYVTDPGAGASSTARIIVTFSYRKPDGEFETELDRFLSGVHDLYIGVV